MLGARRIYAVINGLTALVTSAYGAKERGINGDSEQGYLTISAGEPLQVLSGAGGHTERRSALEYICGRCGIEKTSTPTCSQLGARVCNL